MSRTFFTTDNAKPITTRVTMNYIQVCLTLPGPARSPEPSAIEHIWDVMGRRLQPPPEILTIYPSSWKQFGTKFCRIPPGNFISLYHAR
ncbi:hypothetical protein TNCV_2781111 [Trichonephila clavipes]|nr:hypothetical protein TNCV_2781111 [Trichonephila clavipes]